MTNRYQSLESFHGIVTANAVAAYAGSTALGSELAGSMASTGSLLERYNHYLVNASKISLAGIAEYTHVPDELTDDWRRKELPLAGPLVVVGAQGGGSAISFNMYYADYQTGKPLRQTRGFLGNVLMGNSQARGTITRAGVLSYFTRDDTLFAIERQKAQISAGLTSYSPESRFEQIKIWPEKYHSSK